jgi:hypothetical protein
VNSLQYDEAEELIREKGVMERAVYVAGAYMAKIIEESTDKETLISSLEKGPEQFIEVFNNNVDILRVKTN